MAALFDEEDGGKTGCPAASTVAADEFEPSLMIFDGGAEVDEDVDGVESLDSSRSLRLRELFDAAAAAAAFTFAIEGAEGTTTGAVLEAGAEADGAGTGDDDGDGSIGIWFAPA